jgi:hypothetical protein
MDRILKLFEALLPVLAFYPRWFQALLALNLSLLAVVLVAGVVMYPQASRLKAIQDTSAEIGISVSVLEERPPDLTGESETILRYSVTRSKDQTIISPSMGYLSRLESGGPIKPIDFTWVPFDWDFPNLDVKIVNNGKQTLLFTEAVVGVTESRLDPTAILLIKPDSFRSNALHFLILNEGWGPARDVKVSFHLVPLEERVQEDYTTPYPYSIALEDITEQLNVDISDAFRQAGVDLDGLADLRIVSQTYGGGRDEVTLRQSDGSDATVSREQFEARRASYLGRFKRGGALVSGEIAFNHTSVDGSERHRTLKFATVVWIFDENRVGVPRPPSYQYAVRLLVDGTTYERRLNISHEIKPGETDRFAIKLGVDESSRHIFHLRLLYNRSASLDTGEIRLLTFVPRSGARYIEASAHR